MSWFGMKELVLRIEIPKLGASSDSCGIFEGSFEMVAKLCLRSEFEAKMAKAFEIQTRAG